MEKKVGIISMWLFLGLTLAFQLAYYIGLRGMISNVGVFYSYGSPSGRTPRDVADHFVCCVGLVHYFLCGYLYSVKEHYAEKSLTGKNGKIKRWVVLEIFCQLGIFFSYLIVWIDNLILYRMNTAIGHWEVGKSATALYLFLRKKEVIPEEFTWVEQYGDTFDLTLVIAPVFLMLLIYSIHCVFRFIQFKSSDCFNAVWAVWTVVFFLAIVLLIVWEFRQLDLSGWWLWYYRNIWT